MPALQITNLVKKYGSTVAVDDISLTVPQGAFLGLLGPNGAGKSTTINCTVGVNTITSGTIEVFGHNVDTDYREARKRVGVSPQEFNIDIFGKVTNLLDYVAGYYGLNKIERKERIDELITQFNLTKHAHKPFQALSGGLKRRVILARALVHNPDLLILDEPTAGVDVELRRELWGYLQQLSKEGKTIVLTSHYLEEVKMLADTLAFISGGKIVAEGKKDELLQQNDGDLEALYLSLTKAQ